MHIRQRPEGSIEGLDAIERLIAQAQSEPIPVYEASIKFNDIVEYWITSQSTLFTPSCLLSGDGDHPHQRFLTLLMMYSRLHFYTELSMLDKNVLLNSYNDWFLFTDKELAQRYVAGGARE